jgi:hypothetical protein
MVELLLEFSRVGKYDAINTQPLGSFDMATGIVNKHGLVGWYPQFWDEMTLPKSKMMAFIMTTPCKS